MSNVVELHRSSINKKLKYSRFLEEYPSFNLGSLAITLMCVILMIVATFSLLPVGIFNSQLLANPIDYLSDINNILLTLHSQLYSAQIPIAIFAGALLGPRLGTASMVIYVLLGLIGVPIFASGGGIEYLFKPVFGFIIGYIIAAYLVGKILSGKVSSLNIIFATLMGIVTVHFFGVTYLVIDMLISGSPINVIKAWVWGLSFINLPYDILFSFVLCALARPIRGLLWIAME